MSDLVLKDINIELLDELNENANNKGVFPEEEAKQWLWQVMERKRFLQKFISAADDLARRACPQPVDSTDLIRESREA